MDTASSQGGDPCVGPFQRQSLAFEVTFVSHEWSGLQHPDPKMLGLAVKTIVYEHAFKNQKEN